MGFIKKINQKYKIISKRSQDYEYVTFLEMWKEGDNVYAYMGNQNPKVEITKVFKTHDTSWLNEATEKDPIEVELVMYGNISGGSKGSFDEPPDAPEVELYDVTLEYKNIKIDISDILDIHLKGTDKTYEASLYDDALERFSQKEDEELQFAKEQRTDWKRDR